MPYIPGQYDSAKAFRAKAALPNISNDQDAERLSAYQLYDDFYYNRPETFKVTVRERSDTEIYLPSTKKIVNATARFLAVDFSFTLQGDSDDGAMEAFLSNLFKRETLAGRFIRSKKTLLTRGDVFWYITANPDKPEGKRLNINTIHAGNVFPIENADEDYRVIGYHIVDLVHDPRDKTGDQSKQVARRQTYRRATEEDEESGITFEIGTFEIGAWDDRTLPEAEIKPVSIIRAKEPLPPQITAFPLYHIPNNEPDGSSWGTSQVAGIEYIINALNQSMTYEDLTLVLQGLGLYVSTAAPPIDKTTGQPGLYKFHPGNVIEIEPGDEFSRVTGVSSITPFLEHISSLDRWALDGVGLPDMATGSVDVSVAQSGISLALKMGPVIAENGDREVSIGGRWDQIGYDLINGWLPAYESLNMPDCQFNTVFGDPMPLNRESHVTETVTLYSINLITIEEARERLEAIGYSYTEDIVRQLLTETAMKALAMGGELFTGEAGTTAGEPPPSEYEQSQGSSVSSSVNGEKV